MESTTQGNISEKKDGNFYKEKYGKKSHKHYEKTENFSERRAEKNKKLSEEIESLGLTSQIASLQEKGFTKLKKIYKALVQNENDLEKTILFLSSKNTKKEERRKARLDKDKSLEENVKSLNLESQVQTIQSQFAKLTLRKILKTLSKNDNDLDKSIQYLKENSRDSKREARYKELFPEDKDFDWEKFKATKKTQRVKNKEEKYRKIFPDDKEIDFEKLKAFKGEKKLKKQSEREEREKHLKTEICSEVKTLYLDGNNMLFIDSTLRSLCLKKKYAEACEKMATLTVTCITDTLKLNTTLVFDRQSKVYATESEGVKFKVCSANPNFETSDDALVEWAGGLSASELATTLFVTSDRELLTRLISKGVSQIMKSNTWWKIMKEKLGEEVYNGIVAKEI